MGHGGRGELLPIGQGDLNLLYAIDDVVIGENVAAAIDDHAGAHAMDFARLIAGNGFAFAHRLLAFDVHHRRTGRLHGLHESGAPQFRGFNACLSTYDKRKRQTECSQEPGRSDGGRSIRAGVEHGETLWAGGETRAAGRRLAGAELARLWLGAVLVIAAVRWCHRPPAKSAFTPLPAAGTACLN